MRFANGFDFGGKVRGKVLYRLTVKHLVLEVSCGVLSGNGKCGRGGKKGWLMQQNVSFDSLNKVAPANAELSLTV